MANQLKSTVVSNKNEKTATVKTFEGTVVSNKRDKTITVKVTRRVFHKDFGKIVSTSKKFHVHVENQEAYKLGDVVTFKETRPISKTKKWIVSSENI